MSGKFGFRKVFVTFKKLQVSDIKLGLAIFRISGTIQVSLVAKIAKAPLLYFMIRKIITGKIILITKILKSGHLFSCKSGYLIRFDCLIKQLNQKYPFENYYISVF